MTALELAALDNLVPAEKLDLLERLWTSLLRVPASVPVAPSQLQVVRERLAEHCAAPNDVVDLGDAVESARVGL